MKILTVSPEHLPALSALAAKTFSDTFGHLYPAEDLQDFLRTAYAPEVLAVQVADPDHFWRMAWLGGEAVAYLQLCPVGLPHPDADPAKEGELKRLYVDVSQHGAGIGKQLLTLGLDYLSDRYGDAPQWIGVWSENFKAQAIYRARGFEKVGEYGFTVGTVTDREFILRKG
jgi:ribosomal protein S18 acetylase RimI-like enzyme